MHTVLELDTDTAVAWAQKWPGIAPERVTVLAGGVSNTVLLLETADRRVVVKQSLPQLRVEAEWLCDRTRIWRECEAMKTLGLILPAGLIPRVIAEDRDNYAFAMEAAPEGSVPWKTSLLAGDCDRGTAEQAGFILGETIRLTEGNSELVLRFDDLAIFDQLRLDPYYRYTAARHPGLRNYFEWLVLDCETNRTALVHGDWSPKNLLVCGPRALLIDWECVHFGNPAFDAAFVLNHLLLKSFFLPARAADFASLAAAFWRAVTASTGGTAHFERSTIAHWGGLLLARMDGKSPVEYITDYDQKDGIRRFAMELIASPPTFVGDVFDRRLATPEG